MSESQAQKDYEFISNRKYQKLKHELKEMEAVNFDSIIIIPCSGRKGWMELAEHSALFFYYGPVQKLHLRYKFTDDAASFFNQYDIGYIHTLSIDSIRTHLKRVSLYKSEEKRSYFTIIKLTKSYTKDEVAELNNLETSRRLANLTVKDAVNLDPRLHQVLTHLSIRLHRLCNGNLDKLSSLTRGVEIINLIDNILGTYHQITMMKNVPKSKVLDKLILMRADIYRLIIAIKVLGDAKLWDLDICASVSEPIFTARDYIEHNIKRLTEQIRKSQPPTQPAKQQAPLQIMPSKNNHIKD